jgi:RND family efflux transporter MFP subunit
MNRRTFPLHVAALCGALLIPALSHAAGPTGTDAAQTVSAQVRVAPLRRGQLARVETGVGTIGDAAGRTLSVSFARGVQIDRVLVRPGTPVHRGQPLLQVRGTPGSEAPLIQAQAAVRYATGELARVRQLAASQLATASQVDAARRQLADAQAQLNAARQQHLGGGTQTVRAAFDGVVTALNAAPGLQLAPGAVALTLAPADALQATVGVSVEIARRLQPGQRVPIQSVFDADQAATARILAVARVIDPRTRRVDVVLTVPRQADWAMPGLAVSARFSVQPWSGWVVPRQAVLRDARGQAYVFQDDLGRARRVNVEIDAEEGERSGIAGPLDPAMPLVVIGNYELADGMALRVLR